MKTPRLAPKDALLAATLPVVQRQWRLLTRSAFLIAAGNAVAIELLRGETTRLPLSLALLGLGLLIESFLFAEELYPGPTERRALSSRRSVAVLFGIAFKERVTVRGLQDQLLKPGMLRRVALIAVLVSGIFLLLAEGRLGARSLPHGWIYLAALGFAGSVVPGVLWLPVGFGAVALFSCYGTIEGYDSMKTLVAAAVGCAEILAFLLLQSKLAEQARFADIVADEPRSPLRRFAFHEWLTPMLRFLAVALLLYFVLPKPMHGRQAKREASAQRRPAPTPIAAEPRPPDSPPALRHAQGIESAVAAQPQKSQSASQKAAPGSKPEETALSVTANDRDMDINLSLGKESASGAGKERSGPQLNGSDSEGRNRDGGGGPVDVKVQTESNAESSPPTSAQVAAVQEIVKSRVKEGGGRRPPPKAALTAADVAAMKRILADGKGKTSSGIQAAKAASTPAEIAAVKSVLAESKSVAKNSDGKMQVAATKPTAADVAAIKEIFDAREPGADGKRAKGPHSESSEPGGKNARDQAASTGNGNNDAAPAPQAATTPKGQTSTTAAAAAKYPGQSPSSAASAQSAEDPGKQRDQTSETRTTQIKKEKTVTSPKLQPRLKPKPKPEKPWDLMLFLKRFWPFLLAPLLVVLGVLLKQQRAKKAGQAHKASGRRSNVDAKHAQQQLANELSEIERLLAAGGSDHREMVIALYNALLNYFSECGYPREQHQTPDEFHRQLALRLRTGRDEFGRLTRSFYRCFYGRITPTPEVLDDCVRCATHLGKARLDPPGESQALL